MWLILFFTDVYVKTGRDFQVFFKGETHVKYEQS